MLVIVLPLSGRPLSMPVMGITAAVVGIIAAVGFTAAMVGGITAVTVGIAAVVVVTSAAMVGIAAVVGTAGMVLVPASAAALHLNRRHCVLSCTAVCTEQELRQ
mmetsp:Transcript_20815/g.42933  ORF Transcript_20815/g.42933 Transcript_20815/m.42933 type:complete len:104 (+) Transcript_20815:133-444(+)